MSDVVIEKVNEGFVRIFCARPIAIDIRNNYKFFAPGYKFHPKYRNPRKRVWDGKVSLFDRRTRLFPSGLLDDLTSFFDRSNFTYEFNFSIENRRNYNIDDAFLEKFYKIIFKNSIYYPRDYQHEAIKQLLINKKAVVEEATGSGKSLIIYCLLKISLGLEKRIVLVVPNIMLVEQMRRDFRDYGWETCDDFLTIMYMDHIPDTSKPVLISTYQSLVKQDDSFIMRYNAVIIDEAHQAPAHSIQTILSKLVYADFRMGMTGTLPDEEDPEELGKLYEVFGYLGPMVAQKTASELIDEGYLSRIKIANLIIKYPEEICKKNRSRNYEEEVITITETPERNGIFKYILNRIPDDENTIILCYKLKHLDSIYNYVLTNFGHRFKIRKISGSVEADENRNSEAGRG